jgi:SSS family solute:Na+ symporter
LAITTRGKRRQRRDTFWPAATYWWAIGARFSPTLGASIYRLAGTGASSGLAVGHFEWLASLIVLILGWVFVPFYLRSNVYTMPEFLERRYSQGFRYYLASVSLVAYVFTKIAVAIFAGAIVLKAVLGWGMWQSSFALIIATGIYTVAGGLAAVIYGSDQTVVLM